MLILEVHKQGHLIKRLDNEREVTVGDLIDRDSSFKKLSKLEKALK